MLMSVRDMDVLRLLCWCQNVRPDDLSSISTETERENLITLGLIKRHQRSDTLLLTNGGRAFLQAALEGDVPNLTLSYHDAAIERRVRLSSLMMTAYHAGINVLTITANSLAEPSTLFITAITRSRGHNPWGSARVGAIAHLGSTYYAVHYIYSGIGRMAVNDELAAFHNHTNFGKDTQRAFLFAGASYADIIEELKARDEKRDAKLIRYSEAYEEIPVPLEMPEDVRTAYKEAEHELQKVLRTDRKAAQKILSTYLNLLTVYPDQPYDQPEVVHPINGMPIVTPKNCGDFSRLFPKEERVLELVRQKAANGERVLIYTSWTRTDSQKKLQKLLCSEGYRTEILTPQIATDKREDWVNKRVKGGLQVLITNPRCVETGLDLNAFTTIIFYSMGYNLFTLRQASRRSWRINQTALRVEVYMLY